MAVLRSAHSPTAITQQSFDLALATAQAKASAQTAEPPRTSQSDFKPIQTFISALLTPPQDQPLFQIPVRKQMFDVQLKQILKASDGNGKSDPRFQVWVRGRLITELSNRRLAESIVQQLRQVMNQGNMDPSRLQPLLIKGKPGARWGDRTLFTIDAATEQAFGRSGELIAIDWVNQIRRALNESPLSITEAQTQLYKLTETSERLEGLASWYGPYFHGRLTAAGEIFNENEMTAAHPSLPFDTYLKVTNLDNGRTVIVRVNDRGPYWENRTIDLSREAARRLGSESTGVIPVEIVVMERPS